VTLVLWGNREWWDQPDLPVKLACLEIVEMQVSLEILVCRVKRDNKDSQDLKDHRVFKGQPV